MKNLNDEKIGNLPKNINKEIPIPQNDASHIIKLIKESGEVVGYELSNGKQISKEEGILLAKQGGIKGVAIATREGEEYIRSLPDETEKNNLSSLPTISK